MPRTKFKVGDLVVAVRDAERKGRGRDVLSGAIDVVIGTEYGDRWTIMQLRDHGTFTWQADADTTIWKVTNSVNLPPSRPFKVGDVVYASHDKLKDGIAIKKGDFDQVVRLTGTYDEYMVLSKHGGIWIAGSSAFWKLVPPIERAEPHPEPILERVDDGFEFLG